MMVYHNPHIALEKIYGGGEWSHSQPNKNSLYRNNQGPFFSIAHLGFPSVSAFKSLFDGIILKVGYGWANGGQELGSFWWSGRWKTTIDGPDFRLTTWDV